MQIEYKLLSNFWKMHNWFCMELNRFQMNGSSSLIIFLLSCILYLLSFIFFGIFFFVLRMLLPKIFDWLWLSSVDWLRINIKLCKYQISCKCRHICLLRQKKKTKKIITKSIQNEKKKQNKKKTLKCLAPEGVYEPSKWFGSFICLLLLFLC